MDPHPYFILHKRSTWTWQLHPCQNHKYYMPFIIIFILFCPSFVCKVGDHLSSTPIGTRICTTMNERKIICQAYQRDQDILHIQLGLQAISVQHSNENSKTHQQMETLMVQMQEFCQGAFHFHSVYQRTFTLLITFLSKYVQCFYLWF